MESILIKFSRRELQESRQAALARAQFAINADIDGSVAENSSRQVDMLGVRGELAVAKLFNVDTTIQALGLDDGVDIWIDDISIDVKSSFYEKGKLLFPTLEKFRADIGVLVTGYQDKDDVCIRGWITKMEFAKKSKKDDLGHGRCYTMEQDKLRPMHELWLNLAKRRLSK